MISQHWSRTLINAKILLILIIFLTNYSNAQPTNQRKQTELKKSAWSNLNGGWGKRASSYNGVDGLNDDVYFTNQNMLQKEKYPDDNSVEQLENNWDESINTIEDNNNNNNNNNMDYNDYSQHEAKRAWKSMNGAWGKRVNNWNNFRGSWGKREPGWNNLKGLWGKRSAQWNKLQPIWG